MLHVDPILQCQTTVLVMSQRTISDFGQIAFTKFTERARLFLGIHSLSSLTVLLQDTHLDLFWTETGTEGAQHYHLQAGSYLWNWVAFGIVEGTFGVSLPELVEFYMTGKTAEVDSVRIAIDTGYGYLSNMGS
ncbi:MAG: hypothetical protein GYB68_06510 [Chloroflexi bacterium]|nr:hypothetical protein [Chloroflexota bacterium]